MNETEKLEVKGLLKQALEERSLEYRTNHNLQIRKRDFTDLFSNKIFLFIVPLFFIIVILFYFYDLEKKTVDKEIEKVKIVKIKKQDLLFTDLKTNIQNKYIKKSIYSNLSEEYNMLKSIHTKESNKILILNKELSTLKKNKILNGRYSKLFCSDSKVANKTLSYSCVKRVKSFLNKYNKDTIQYQIIAVLDNNDYKKFSYIKSKSQKEYLKLGLGRARVLEAAWLVKNILGKTTRITYVNYVAHSKKGRGIIIRAYK